MRQRFSTCQHLNQHFDGGDGVLSTSADTVVPAITDCQAANILTLMVDMEETAPGDNHLYPTGPHRNFYHNLIR